MHVLTGPQEHEPVPKPHRSCSMRRLYATPYEVGGDTGDGPGLWAATIDNPRNGAGIAVVLQER